MNQGITIELQFFMISILWGALVLLAYDLLRILRRIIPHSSFFIAVQDMIFWVLASVFIFAMIYVKNSGTIRGFSVMGMVIGVVIYHYILSDWVVTLISRGILLLLRPFSIALKYLYRVIGFLTRRLKILKKMIYSQLKSRAKSVKISVNTHRQKRSAKTQKKKEKKNVVKNKKKNKNKIKNKKKNKVQNQKKNKVQNKRNTKEK